VSDVDDSILGRGQSKRGMQCGVVARLLRKRILLGSVNETNKQTLAKTIKPKNCSELRQTSVSQVPSCDFFKRFRARFPVLGMAVRQGIGPSCDARQPLPGPPKKRRIGSEADLRCDNAGSYWPKKMLCPPMVKANCVFDTDDPHMHNAPTRRYLTSGHSNELWDRWRRTDVDGRQGTLMASTCYAPSSIRMLNNLFHELERERASRGIARRVLIRQGG
jgi:hypothetical protein